MINCFTILRFYYWIRNGADLISAETIILKPFLLLDLVRIAMHHVESYVSNHSS